MNQIDTQTPDNTPGYAAPPPQDQARVEEPARLGPFARLTGTLFSPGETFVDINRKPTIIAPLLIAIVTVVAGAFFFQWWVNPDWDTIMRNTIKRQMAARNQTLTEEQMSQQVAFAKGFAKFGPVIGAVVTPLFYAIIAGVFALGMMFIQAKSTFKKILSVVYWSWAATGLVLAIVTIASLLVKDEASRRSIDPTQSAGILPTNLASFLPSDMSAVIKTVAGSIDLFTIWFLILVTIGLAAIAGSKKITTGKTATVVFGFWVVYVLLKVGWAAAFGG